MDKDEIRQMLLEDVEHYRDKAKVYEALRLSEAGDYARKLASNIELALTTLPSENDPDIY